MRGASHNKTGDTARAHPELRNKVIKEVPDTVPHRRIRIGWQQEKQGPSPILVAITQESLPWEYFQKIAKSIQRICFARKIKGHAH